MRTNTAKGERRKKKKLNAGLQRGRGREQYAARIALVASIV